MKKTHIPSWFNDRREYRFDTAMLVAAAKARAVQPAFISMLSNRARNYREIA